MFHLFYPLLRWLIENYMHLTMPNVMLNVQSKIAGFARVWFFICDLVKQNKAHVSPVPKWMINLIYMTKQRCKELYTIIFIYLEISIPNWYPTHSTWSGHKISILLDWVTYDWLFVKSLLSTLIHVLVKASLPLCVDQSCNSKLHSILMNFVVYICWFLLQVTQ